MPDYEIENALEWDLHKQVSVSPAQNAPSKHKQSTENEGIAGRGRFGVLQEAAGLASQPKPVNENKVPQRSQAKPSRQTVSQAPQQHGGKQPLRKQAASSSPVPAKKSHQQSQRQQQKPQTSNRERSMQAPQQRYGRQTRQRLRLPKMAPGSDNDGEKQWRRREPAQAHVRLPIDLAELKKDHFHIAKQHKAFLLHDGFTTGGRTAEFGIWGEPDAVQKTMQDIQSWIDEHQASPRKSKGNPNFAKICSLTEPLRLRAEKRWENEVKKHRFRQFPPPNKTFDAIGTFYWPVKEYKPEEVLGFSYEALDAIRMEFKCYVVFHEEQGLFHVMGKADAVQAALLRLRGTYFQIVAQTIPALELHLLHDADEYNGVIVLMDYERISAISGEVYTQNTIPKIPLANNEGLSSTVAGAFSNEDTVRHSMLTTLKKLHYYRGSMQMRVRFGKFLATQYMGTREGCYSMDRYQMMIKQSEFQGEITQELGDRRAEINIHSGLEDAAEFLVPQDPMIRDLSSITPLYQAVLTFVDPINNELGDIRLTLTWQEQQDWNSSSPTYEQISKKWTRLDRDTKAPVSIRFERDAQAPASILGVTLSSTTGMAYQFEINAAPSIEEDRLPRGFAEYVDSIRPDPKASQRSINSTSSDISFLTYRSSFPHLKSLEQRLVYRYGIKGSDYTLELARFQHRTFSPKKSLVAASTEPTIYEPRWGLSFYRNEWDTMFAKNERLPIGERADWSHEEIEWFSKDHVDGKEDVEGFAGMMSKLKRIQNLVKEAANDDLIGGMRVG